MLEWLRRRFCSKGARQLPITDTDWIEAESSIHCLTRLKPQERIRLRTLAQAFIADKQWAGAGGLILDASMQISIALQAALPVLNLGLEWYRGWVGIVIYPGDFIVHRISTDEAGVVHEYADPLLGETWEGGPLVLSWFLSHEQPQGINVIIHELAHKLDMLNGGVANGLPPLHRNMSRQDWQNALGNAYTDFRQQIAMGKATAELDPYGAEHPGEFFAVLSEAFFEIPETLGRLYPNVYAQLHQFYRQDPCASC